jgi:hypothetical protein
MSDDMPVVDSIRELGREAQGVADALANAANA